jgi:abequosyltransferase
MKEYLLAICIPTYNRSSFLKGLLENIYSELKASENVRNVQIVVVDGNSSDNTAEVVTQFEDKLSLKYFKREKREGIDKDILKCVELSDGKYCWLFSDDDRLASGSISHILKLLSHEKNLTGCFCNRIPYDSHMERRVAEIKGWPGKIIKADRIFKDKAEFFKCIGMDFGFISSQVVKRSTWQEIADNEVFGDLSNTYYLMAHIIARMMDREFKWLYISNPLVKQRTGNDSFLEQEGIVKRQLIEHNSFQIILDRHYDKESKVRKKFFSKMVDRLPRAIANLKSQHIGYRLQYRLLKLYYDKYKHYLAFWFKVIPVFFVPNIIFCIVKRLYFKYLVRC